MEYIPLLISESIVLAYYINKLAKIYMFNELWTIIFTAVAIAGPIITLFCLKKLQRNKYQDTISEALQENHRLQRKIEDLNHQNIVLKIENEKLKKLSLQEKKEESVMIKNKELLIRIDERTKNSECDILSCKEQLQQLRVELMMTNQVYKDE